MNTKERKKYPALAKVEDLKEEHSKSEIGLVQDVLEYIFENYDVCTYDGKHDLYYPIGKTIEQILYEYWGIDYRQYKKEWNKRMEELLSEEAPND